jgi:hypothetical protein
MTDAEMEEIDEFMAGRPAEEAAEESAVESEQ